MDDDKALARALSRALINYIDTLKGRGYDMIEIAIDLGVSEEQAESFYRSAREQLHADKVEVAQKLREDGNSNRAIATLMGINERQVIVLIGTGETKGK